jgi:acyl-coenzyme A thioesterase PaaI-like protein
MPQDSIFEAAPQYRVVSPELGLNPPNTDPNLYSSAVAHFRTIPWCAALIDAPGAVCFISGCRNPASPMDNQLLGNVLATEDRVAHMLCVLEPADAANAQGGPSQIVRRVHTLIATGDGISGYPGVVQGGAVMALIDDSLGVVLEINMVLHKEGAPFQTNAVTSTMDVQFRRPVPTGAPVRIEAWLDAVDGRRSTIACRLVDGDGVELAKCKSKWVALRPNI